MPARLRCLFLLCSFLLVTGCDSAESDPDAPDATTRTVIDLLRADQDLDDFTAALESTELDQTLSGSGPFTIFAPTDEAFFLLGEEALATLLDGENASLLRKVLGFHIVEGRLSAADLRALSAVTTQEGVTLPVQVRADGALLIDGNVVSEADLLADNGVLHKLERVVRSPLSLAERIELAPLIDRFRTGLERTGLDALLTQGEPVTIFAPLDDGFLRLPGGASPLFDAANEDLLEPTLRYHVIPGRRTLDELVSEGTVETLQGATLTVTRTDGELPEVNEWRIPLGDIQTENGILHFVERPLLEVLSIGERIRLIPDLSRLQGAFTTTNQADLLNGEGPYTLFAPTDAAFSALGMNVFTPLLANARPELLDQLVRFHLGIGRYPFADLDVGDLIPTVSGDPIRIQSDDETGERLAAQAPFSSPVDLGASNGVIHLMSGVLDPPLNLYDQLFFSGYTPFTSMIDQAGLQEMYQTGGPYTVVAPFVVPSAFFNQNLWGCFADRMVLSHTAEGLYPIQLPATVIPDLDPLADRVITISAVEASREADAKPDTNPTIFTSPVREFDVEATNGLIHGIEDVIWRPTLYNCQ